MPCPNLLHLPKEAYMAEFGFYTMVLVSTITRNPGNMYGKAFQKIFRWTSVFIIVAAISSE